MPVRVLATTIATGALGLWNQDSAPPPQTPESRMSLRFASGESNTVTIVFPAEVHIPREVFMELQAGADRSIEVPDPRNMELF